VATVSRSTKDNGSTSWASGDTLNAADLNGDIDPLVTQINGALDDTNLANNAVIEAKIASNAVVNVKVNQPATRADGIASAKISNTDADWSEGTGARTGGGSWTTGLESDAITSHSNTADAYAATTDPGVTGSFTYPDTLSQELERIRYILKRMGLGAGAELENATNSAAWYDGNTIGPNLISNPSFLDYVAGGATAPQGWTAVGTSPTFNGQSTALSVTEGAGKALLFTAGHENNNMTQTLTSLRASTKYLIEARVKPTTGTVKLITTGAASGEFDDLDLVSSGAGWQTLSGVVATDGTPAAIVVTIDPQGATDVVQISHVSCKEVSVADRLSRNDGSGIVVRKTSSSGSPGTIAGALAATVVAPCPNSKIRVTINVAGVAASGDNNSTLIMTLSETINGGSPSAVAVSKVGWFDYVTSNTASLHIDYVNSAPTVGGVHAYTIAIAVANNSTCIAGDYHWMQVEVITP
jgi:hypothetical protein